MCNCCWFGRVYCCSCLVWVLLSYVYLLYCLCIAVFCTLDAGLLARSQYSEGPATGHLDTGFSWFPCVYKQMLRWFPTFQVATTRFSCSPPDLNLVVTNFIFSKHVKLPLPPGDNPIAVNKYIIIIIYYFQNHSVTFPTTQENKFLRSSGWKCSCNWPNYFYDSSPLLSRFDAVVRAVRLTCDHFAVLDLHFSSISSMGKWDHKLDTEFPARSTSPFDKSFSRGNYL